MPHLHLWQTASWPLPHRVGHPTSLSYGLHTVLNSDDPHSTRIFTVLRIKTHYYTVIHLHSTALYSVTARRPVASNGRGQ